MSDPDCPCCKEQCECCEHTDEGCSCDCHN